MKDRYPSFSPFLSLLESLEHLTRYYASLQHVAIKSSVDSVITHSVFTTIRRRAVGSSECQLTNSVVAPEFYDSVTEKCVDFAAFHCSPGIGGLGMCRIVREWTVQTNRNVG